MATLTKNSDGTFSLTVSGKELREIEEGKPIKYEGSPGRTRRAARRRAGHGSDPAWESERFLRDMEGVGDYEGPRTWP